MKQIKIGTATQTHKKKCRKCNEWKAEEDFTKNIKKADGISLYCKACSRILEEMYREKNKEKIKKSRSERKGSAKEITGNHQDKLNKRLDRFGVYMSKV